MTWHNHLHAEWKLASLDADIGLAQKRLSTRQLRNHGRRPIGFESTAIDKRSGSGNENHDLGSGFSRGGRNKKWKVFGNGWGASF